MRSCVVVWPEKKSSFLGSPRDVFRRPSAAPKFLHTTFPSTYFVLAEFHPPRLSFGGVMPPTPSFASLQYGLPYTIWQDIKTHLTASSDKSVAYVTNNKRLYSTFCTVEANYWQTGSITRPLCDSRATCFCLPVCVTLQFLVSLRGKKLQPSSCNFQNGKTVVGIMSLSIVGGIILWSEVSCA